MLLASIFSTFFAFFPSIFNFYPSVKDFCIQLGTFGLILHDLPHAHVMHCLSSVVEPKSNSLGDGSFKNGLFMGSSSLAPIIKIFSPVFFTVNLFLAPIDRILCHGQFRIEAQSLQKRSDLPLSSLLLQLLLNRVCTSIDGMAPKRSHPAANSRGPLNTPVLIQSLKLSNVEPC